MEFVIRQPEKNVIEMVWQTQSMVPKLYKCVGLHIHISSWIK